MAGGKGLNFMRFGESWLVVLGVWLACGCGGGMPSETEAPAPAANQAAPEPEAAPEKEAAPAGEQPSTMAPAAPGPPPQAPAGAAPPPSSAAEAADEGEALQTVEQAQALLARAEQELQSLFGHGAQRKERAAGAPSPASAPAAARPPARSRPRSPCASACRAFASLDRAAGAVCRLAGESDARCLRAKQSVKENAQRVASCDCPSSRGE
jgi:hypothetical protein